MNNYRKINYLKLNKNRSNRIVKNNNFINKFKGILNYKTTQKLILWFLIGKGIKISFK